MSNISILIVEDQAIIVYDLASKVERLGYDVVGITATGEEAIELARQHRPALVWMDPININSSFGVGLTCCY